MATLADLFVALGYLALYIFVGTVILATLFKPNRSPWTAVMNNTSHFIMTEEFPTFYCYLIVWPIVVILVTPFRVVKAIKGRRGKPTS